MWLVVGPAKLHRLPFPAFWRAALSLRHAALSSRCCRHKVQGRGGVVMRPGLPPNQPSTITPAIHYPSCSSHSGARHPSYTNISHQAIRIDSIQQMSQLLTIMFITYPAPAIQSHTHTHSHPYNSYPINNPPDTASQPVRH